ncbi:hypothetical protein [Dictyobacter arantiisoli]|uniref:Uncharacterized protein n=1 Tax=Dictyobacter arantiisoli TaxID=2014874 RepID=A0A5A5T659_9CHLR|nr:hypothetical protein [Dictyobacter arantiisoli]GCF06503.1 hypothetical protein KDI_00670 [Dictyobacter arantiisoli]
MHPKTVHTDELFQSPISTEHNLTSIRCDKTPDPALAQAELVVEPLPIRPSLLRLILIVKHVLLALDTVVLSVLCYRLLEQHPVYCALAWLVLLLLWAYLAWTPLRQRIRQMRLKCLWILGISPTPDGMPHPTVNTYRDAHLRELQDDTTAYMQALRQMHAKTKR